MVDAHQVDIQPEGEGWLVRICSPGLRPQEYHCATREQADGLAAVMSGNKSQARGTTRLRPAGSSETRPPPLPRQQTRK